MEQKRRTFFSSDHHFSHNNIIKYANRPFKNVDEMNEAMIERHNSVVTPQDIVWFIGDFTFERDEERVRRTIRRLNGEINFVKGNHDKPVMPPRVRAEFNQFINSCHHEIYVPDSTLEHGRQAITLCHFAMRVWNKSHHGAFHLYGHSHGSLPEDPNSRSFDIGVDEWDFYPVSYEQVKAKMATKNWKPIDHHGAD